ncbi:hypothetical protein M8C21_017672 [Ambrosia artemisiifolia]|uniref:Uncharacterized protein n=1 Tax=Ambrosia artemisiifolia TaxID=4212 RepID=A0AAD5CBY7_AMBAR|nr:hypothetical protein M8C21_017672 [Ambrosia artemisiifolia]
MKKQQDDEQQLLQQRMREYKQRHRELVQLRKEFKQQREEFKQRLVPAMQHARQVKRENEVLRLLLHLKQQEVEQQMEEKNERLLRRHRGPSFQAVKDFIGGILAPKEITSYKRLEKVQMGLRHTKD